MTTQFDGIYYGLSPEVGSKCYLSIADSKIFIVDALPSVLNRVPSCAERDGLEGGRERGDQVNTFHGYQVDPVVTRCQELSDQSGLEGREQGDPRWLCKRCGLRSLFLLPPTVLITGVGVPSNPLPRRIMTNWLRCSSNISAHSWSRRRYRSEGGIGVRLISKVISGFANHVDLPTLTHGDLAFPRPTSRVSRREQNRVRAPPPVRRELEYRGSNGSLSGVPTSKPHEIETVQTRPG